MLGLDPIWSIINANTTVTPSLPRNYFSSCKCYLEEERPGDQQSMMIFSDRFKDDNLIE